MRKQINITEHLLCRNRPEQRFYFHKLCNFVYTGLFLFFICVVPLVLNAEETEAPAAVASPTENSVLEAENSENEEGASANRGSAAGSTTETITGTSKRMERFEKEGITVLIDEAKTVRYNEQGVEIGFLNADKITLKSDPETGATTEVIAVGSVEIRDQDIFATCDQAIMNNLTNTVVLKENVVVLQNRDRLETKLFTFNRTTGKQTGEGGVKFKVTVTQAEPVKTETGADAEGGASTTEDETSTATLDGTEGEIEKDPNADMPKANGDAKEKPDADIEGSEDTDSEDETDTDAEDVNSTDKTDETEDSESD